MLKTSFIFLLFLASPLAMALVYPGTLELEASLESMAFSPDQKEETTDYNQSFFGRFKNSYSYQQVEGALAGFFRYDATDHQRDFIYPEDTFMKYDYEGVRFYFGTKVFNFSSTEIFHPADGVNSKVLSGNLVETEKVGEPVVSVDFPFYDGEIALYYFPYFIPSKFPSEKSRLGLDLDLGSVKWLDRDGSLKQNHQVNQIGAKISQSFSGLDLGFHLLHHVDRQSPMIAVNPVSYGKNPVFGEAFEYGVTLQNVFENGLIVKAEVVRKDYLSSKSFLTIYGMRSFKDQTSGVLSFEYGLGPFEGVDSTLIIEGQNIFELNRIERDEAGFFSRDLLIGNRLTFNDAHSNELFIGMVIDVERSHQYYALLDYSFRYNDSVNIELGARYIDAPVKGDRAKGLEVLNQDHSLYGNVNFLY